MIENELILTEQYGSSDKEVNYICNDNELIQKVDVKISLSTSIITSITDIFRDIFLPYGYPDSVSDDYFDYQVWDTIQAFCSTITGTFTTQAILRGVGVGDASAQPLAATITWIIKDGMGMVGRIIFAWWNGSNLDTDCKKWRLVADILNDAAMFLELLLPYVSHISLQLLCVTTSMKAVVGVAGGATRASITQHQAIKGNMGDVSAKDGSQETCVNLIASIIGIFLLTLIDGNVQYEWMTFTVFVGIHIMANYFAVRALVFNHLNESRLILMLCTYLKFDTVTNPVNLNQKEPIFFRPSVQKLCGFQVKMGVSMEDVVNSVNAQQLKDIIEACKNKPYLLVPDMKKKIIYVGLQPNEQTIDVLTAYFHGVLLAIALCKYNHIPLNLNDKLQLHHITPTQRLNNLMKSFPRNNAVQKFVFPLDKFISFNEFITGEIQSFFTALSVNEWNTNIHSISMGEWRCRWRDSLPRIPSKHKSKIN